MRALKSLFGMATLALAASLAGCGGGGDAGAPRTPLGTLVVTGSPLNGEVLQDTSLTDGNSTAAELHFQGRSGIMNITFNATTGDVSTVYFNDGDFVAPYECDDTTGTPCTSVSVDTSAQTITFNGQTLKTASDASLSLRGTLDLRVPAP